ncbi:molybdopterin-binding oxidoreductase, partial [Streptomyces rubrogriseus]|nr:molybdopterin-binding oxidoreductase [Streptomyces rubrogriseus]
MSDHDKTPRNPSARTWTRLGLGALSGLLAGGAALAVAELAAAAVRPRSGPVVAVGGAAVDRTPTAVKDWAIRTFGTNDKLVLQLGILAVLTLFALALGAFAVRHRRAGAAGVLVFGVVGAAAALGRPDSAGVTDAFPSVLGAIAGAVLLYLLVGLLPAPRREAPGERGEGWDRRRFVIAATAVAAAS